MIALREEIETADEPEPLGDPPRKPHIIALQMEAYGDPGIIDQGIAFQNELFAPLQPYAGEIQRFNTLVSVLGGGTANTEYEFLTGYNMYFCPSGVTPFIRYVNQSKPSLAATLSALGYQTIAVHPHAGSFYSRDTAYPRLGFERFITQEEFDDPVYVGYYISDGSFGKKIIDVFEEEKGNGPLFLFGISIQNHGPYIGQPGHRLNAVELSDGRALNGAQVEELEIYGANIIDSSVMLAGLIQYFSKTDEPVLLLVFGDHQAAWSWSFDPSGGPEQELKRHSTESFFWANYPLRDNSKPLVSASELGCLTMLKAGLELPLYEKGIVLQFNEISAYNSSVYVGNDGSIHYIDRSRVEDFRMLQYDRMFGKNYLDRD
jgi:hypothetical protein